MVPIFGFQTKNMEIEKGWASSRVSFVSPACTVHRFAQLRLAAVHRMIGAASFAGATPRNFRSAWLASFLRESSQNRCGEGQVATTG